MAPHRTNGVKAHEGADALPSEPCGALRAQSGTRRAHLHRFSRGARANLGRNAHQHHPHQHHPHPARTRTPHRALAPAHKARSTRHQARTIRHQAPRAEARGDIKPITACCGLFERQLALGVPVRTRIFRGLGSRSLLCGCFLGVYETYDGETVEIVEEQDPHCSNPAHREGQTVTRDVAPARRQHSHVA